MIIMIFALIITAVRSESGRLLNAWGPTSIAPSSKPYKTPRPADSVAVATPRTTDPTTKTGIVRTTADPAIRLTLPSAPTDTSSRGYWRR